MAVISVPKPPPEAYNTDRPVSSLLTSQIERLQRVVLEAIQTEGQAAEYIRALTRRVRNTHTHVEPRSHRSTVTVKKTVAKAAKKRSPAPRKKSGPKRARPAGGRKKR